MNENSQLNISDVIEVIRKTDPTTAQVMFSKNSEIKVSQQQQEHQQQQQQQRKQKKHQNIHQNDLNNLNNSNNGNGITCNSGIARRNAYVKITEQPTSKGMKFRYESEGRAGPIIPGANSTPKNKTFPSIQVVGYRGKAIVVVSCVTKDEPYKPHPHNLIGKNDSTIGVCKYKINSETMSVTFNNLGVQCVKKRNIERALQVREETGVDPFKTGFSHRKKPSSIDLNTVRLCFQVILESPDQPGNFKVPLRPVVSDPIYDIRVRSDLVICKLSDVTCTVEGGKEIILLCEKIMKGDIAIRFFEQGNDGQLIWEDYGDFQKSNIHKQFAISFRTPKYRTLDITNSVKCFIQLKRPSDGSVSEPLPFEYLPLTTDKVDLRRKQQKLLNKHYTNMFTRLNASNSQKEPRKLSSSSVVSPNLIEPSIDNLVSPYHMLGDWRTNNSTKINNNDNSFHVKLPSPHVLSSTRSTSQISSSTASSYNKETGIQFNACQNQENQHSSPLTSSATLSHNVTTGLSFSVHQNQQNQQLSPLILAPSVITTKRASNADESSSTAEASSSTASPYKLATGFQFNVHQYQQYQQPSPLSAQTSAFSASQYNMATGFEFNVHRDLQHQFPSLTSASQLFPVCQQQFYINSHDQYPFADVYNNNIDTAIPNIGSIQTNDLTGLSISSDYYRKSNNFSNNIWNQNNNSTVTTTTITTPRIASALTISTTTTTTTAIITSTISANESAANLFSLLDTGNQQFDLINTDEVSELSFPLLDESPLSSTSPLNIPNILDLL